MPKPRSDRTAAVYVRMTAAEKKLVDAAAKQNGRTTGKWAQRVLVNVAGKRLNQSKEKP